MLSSVALFVSTLGVLGAQTEFIPDEADLFKAGNAIPEIELLLDGSCSMSWGWQPSNCAHYLTTYPSTVYVRGAVPQIKPTFPSAQPNFGGGDGYDNCPTTGGVKCLRRMDQMKATLTGCQSANDGVLDRWAPYVNFSLRSFGNSPDQFAEFGATLATLESKTIAIGATGGTPMVDGLYKVGRHFQTYFNNSNTKTCRKKFVIGLTDGETNNGGRTFDHAKISPCPTTSGIANVAVAENRPQDGTKYLYDNPIVCNVTGKPSLGAYSIGFGHGSTFDRTTLEEFAANGGGIYYEATSVAALDDAFENIITQIIARSAVFFSRASLQRDGIFSGETAYVASFRPGIEGAWHGNLKRHKVFPRFGTGGAVYDTTDLTAMYKSTDGRTLVTNPAAVDEWGVRLGLPTTETATTGTTRSGAGAVMLAQLGAAGSVPTGGDYWTRRNIKTWRPGTAAYVAVNPTDWKTDDTWAVASQVAPVINRLHGYSRAASASSANPTAVSVWPLGAPVHSPTVLLRYHDKCEAANRCYVVFGANDGMLHFIDAYDGRERVALVPAELWRTGSSVNRNTINDLDDQPTLQTSNRYYVDGGLRLLHQDSNGNGVIEAAEDAQLFFSLGRGGRALYMIPMKKFTGDLTVTDNPIFPITYSGTGVDWREIQSILRSPWLGQATVDGTRRAVAVFASGHVPEFDMPEKDMPRSVPGAKSLVAMSVPCTTMLGAPYNVGYMCSLLNGGLALASTINTPVFKIDGAKRIRACFSSFSVGTAKVRAYNAKAQAAVSLTGTGQAGAEYWAQGMSGGCSPWVYGDSMTIEFSGTGYPTVLIDRFEYDKEVVAANVATAPTVYVVDTGNFNGNVRFAAAASGAGVLTRFMRECPTGVSGNCIDRTTSNASDLAHLSCPISGELSVLTVGDELRSIYFGDLCGQLWNAALTDRTANKWNVRRLLSLNHTAGQWTPLDFSSGTTGYRTRHLMKMFPKLDLASSTCPGRKVTAVYFGSGNPQRPTAADELVGTAYNSGRNVLGVLFDDGLINNLTLNPNGALIDATDVDAVSKSQLLTKKGWFIGLRQYEGAFRDPLVFEGVAFFKTFRLKQDVSECSSASGFDSVYAVNNCTAAAVADPNGDGTNAASERIVWNETTNIGGDLALIAPRKGKAFVTHGNMGSQSNAALVGRTGFTRMPVLNWREPRGIF